MIGRATVHGREIKEVSQIPESPGDKACPKPENNHKHSPLSVLSVIPPKKTSQSRGFWECCNSPCSSSQNAGLRCVAKGKVKIRKKMRERERDTITLRDFDSTRWRGREMREKRFLICRDVRNTIDAKENHLWELSI